MSGRYKAFKAAALALEQDDVTKGDAVFLVCRIDEGKESTMIGKVIFNTRLGDSITTYLAVLETAKKLGKQIKAKTGLIDGDDLEVVP